MKKLITLSLIAIIALATASCSCAKTPFSALSSNKDVTRVYVSNALINTSGSIMNGMPISKSSKIDGIEIFACDSPESATKARELLKAFQAENPLTQELISSNDEEDETLIYGVPEAKDSNTYKTLLITTFEPDEANIIIISGSIQFDMSSKSE